MDTAVLLLILFVFVCVICSSVSGFYGWIYFVSQTKSNNEKNKGENDGLITFLKKFATPSKTETFVEGIESTTDNWDQIMEIWAYIKDNFLPKQIVQDKLKCDNLTRSNIMDVIRCLFQNIDLSNIDDDALGALWITAAPLGFMVGNKNLLLSDIIEYNPETKLINIKAEDIKQGFLRYKPLTITINGKNILVQHLPDERTAAILGDQINNNDNIFTTEPEIRSLVTLDVTYNGITKQILFIYSKTGSTSLSTSSVAALNIDLSKYQYDYTKVPLSDIVQFMKKDRPPPPVTQECPCSVVFRERMNPG